MSHSPLRDAALSRAVHFHPEVIVPTLHRHQIAYSQNFLRSPRLVDRLLDRSGITSGDLVIEIGPGGGAITERLAARCRQVLAVEKDPALAETLRARFAASSNVALFAADFLEFPLPVTRYKVFANIPFNITAAIVGQLTSGISPPADASLCMQREAAQRFLGTPRGTLVAVLLRPWFEPSVTHHFRPGDFAPAPGVEVVLLRLRQRESPLIGPKEEALYGDLATHAFTAWQPTVRSALAQVASKRLAREIERRAGIALDLPPSALPVSDWIALARTYRTVAGDDLRAAQGARARLARQQAGLEKSHRTRTRGLPPRPEHRRGNVGLNHA
jgi:23S rRNA (adenine-N6)-dimethyltransferase